MKISESNTEYHKNNSHVFLLTYSNTQAYYQMKRLTLTATFAFLITAVYAQLDTDLKYRVELGATAGGGTYAPLWFTANRYGLSSVEPNSGYMRAGIAYEKEMRHNWKIAAGIDLAGTVNHQKAFNIQQLYADFSWKVLTLSIGIKERDGFPLEKNTALSSGMMVEGPNAHPLPQIRVEMPEYWNVPGTKGWLAFKGHIAYGSFAEYDWQRDYVNPGQYFTENVLYHSKSLMLRFGNKDRFPLEFEAGILMAAQFGGSRYYKEADGSVTLDTEMPHNLKAYWKAFFPQTGGSDTPEGEQVNVEGNHVGSWNFALNYYVGNWKFRAYLEHYFEDTSQMFWEYGRWKDGQLGLEITFPKNKWVTSAVWEGIATKDQAGPLLYDGFWGQFPEYQISANDDYYNHYIYGGWQYMGMGMGNPLISGPLYNDDHSISFRSNRIRANHLGISGNPSDEWSYRMLISFTRYWGTYLAPLDKQRKQFSSLYEATYSPKWAKGWSASLALGLDRGNYLGNSTGATLTIKKTGTIF